MALTQGSKRNFETLVDAVKHRALALVECTEISTGNPVAVMCAVNRYPGGDKELVPLARLFTGNPYDEVAPPE